MVLVFFDGIIVMDGIGMVVDYSLVVEDVFGWIVVEIVGKKMFDYIILEKYWVMYDVGLKKYFEMGEGLVLGKWIEIEGLYKDGYEIIVELVICYI